MQASLSGHGPRGASGWTPSPGDARCSLGPLFPGSRRHAMSSGARHGPRCRRIRARIRAVMIGGLLLTVIVGVAAGKLAEMASRTSAGTVSYVDRAESLTDSIQRIERYLERYDQRETLRDAKLLEHERQGQ